MINSKSSRNLNRSKRASILSMLAFVVFTLSGALAKARAATDANFGAGDESTPTALEEIKVISGSEEELSLPMAPQTVSKDKVRTFKFTDVNRALRQAPGVYVREEEGQGLRPNIGLRGTNPDRSKKVVLLEDGILIGPAPYSAPAAYYTPSMNHIESLEVFKGFAAVPYGPNSIGGAINYVGRTPPEELTPLLEASYGSFETSNLKASVGDRWEGGEYLLQTSRLKSTGFKVLDGGGNTGFIVHDVAGVVRVELPKSEGRQHRIDLRVGYADQDSDETYLGLTHADFDSSPYRRYSASALDEMRWKHTKLQLSHLAQVSSSALVTTTAYRHDFHRAWYRLDRFRDNSVTLQQILKDPTGVRRTFYEILSGQADSSVLGTNGELIVANNDREYVSQGLQSVFSDVAKWGETRHDLEVTARLHWDHIERDHTFDLYRMSGGRLAATGDARQTDKQNKDSAFAKTLSVRDHMTLGKWVFTGVGRLESVDFRFEDRLASTDRSRTDTVFVPGVGALYGLSETLSARVSINRAATVAGLDTGGNEAREESTNYEAGLKYYSSEAQRQADLIYFFNDYRNLTGTCTISSGCSSSQLDQQFNGGRASIQGVEARVAQGFRIRKLWMPVQMNLTWIRGGFETDFISPSPEWGLGQIRKGDPLPYVPSLQYSLLVGAEYGRFKNELAIIYQGKMYDQSASEAREEVPAYGVVDWAGRYEFSKAGAIFAKADNVLGRDYIAALRPFGFRPGKPRSYMIGLSYAF